MTERTVSREDLFKPMDDEDGVPKGAAPLALGGEEADAELGPEA